MNDVEVCWHRVESELKPYSSTPRLDATLILKHVLDCDETVLYTTDQLMAQTELDLIDSLVRRRQLGEPIAYLIGKKDFWSFTLAVTVDTLIPRPETECLIECLSHFCREDRKKRVLDLGTGSGAIILAIQKEWPDWQCTAVERSKSALAVAKQNALKYGLDQIVFVHADWFSAFSNQRFDLIISNPPYVSPDDPALKALAYEPKAALVADEAGFADLKYLITHSIDFLTQNGCLLIEHGADQQDQLIEFAQKKGFDIIHQGKDYSDKSRFLFLKWTQ